MVPFQFMFAYVYLLFLHVFALVSLFADGLLLCFYFLTLTLLFAGDFCHVWFVFAHTFIIFIFLIILQWFVVRLCCCALARLLCLCMHLDVFFYIQTWLLTSFSVLYVLDHVTTAQIIFLDLCLCVNIFVFSRALLLAYLLFTTTAANILVT